MRESHTYAVSAFTNANSSYQYISKCYESSTVEDIQYFAKKARSLLSNIQEDLSDAESSATNAENEANKIKCKGAESDADDASDAFSSSREEFVNVDYFIKKIVNEVDTDYIESYLKKISDSFGNGILYMKTGIDEINEAVDSLNKCK